MAAERTVSVRVKLNGASKFKSDVAEINTSLDGLGGWMDTAKGILASNVIQQGFSAIAGVIKSCWTNAVDFETAMAGVQKTTDMTDVELQVMANELMNMSEKIPIAATELAGLAEAAGQLGIAKEDITEFVEVAAAMGVSTNLSAEEAATEMARIANIMGTSAQDYERMGSVIVDLGNKMATTESEIVYMAQGMAGVGQIVGMSEADVMAYSAALSSVGIEAEAGASSISTLWTNIETMVATNSIELTDMAEVAGMTRQAFAEMWETDAAGAFQAFISGLREAGAEGESVMAILEELGIREIRQRRAVTSLAGANNVLTQALETSTVAWEEGTALATEAGTFYGTTASQIQMAENALTNLEAEAGSRYTELVTDWTSTGAAIASQIRQNMTELAPLPELIDDANDAYEAQMDTIDETTRQANTLINKLDEMGDIKSLNPQDQEYYLSNLRLLSELVPSVKNIIDTETGAIEGGTEALRANTEAARENAEQAAELERAREAHAAYQAASEQLANKRTLLDVANNDLSAAEAEYDALVARQQELIDEATEIANERTARGEGYVTYGTVVHEIGEPQDNGQSEYYNLEQEIMAANTQINLAEQSVNNLNREIEEERKIIEENSWVVQEYGDALVGMGESYQAAIDGTETLTAAEREQVAEFDFLQQQLDGISEELITATDEARQRLDGVISGFGEIEMPDAVSPEDMIAGLDSQIEYMRTYQENLEKVKGLGLDPDLIEQLSDGSTQSAAILAGLAEDGGESIEELNAKMAEVETTKNSLAESLAQAEINFDTRVDSIVDAANEMVTEVDQYSGAYTSGANTVQGIIDGMNSKLDILSYTSGRVRSLSNVTNGGSGSGTSHAMGLTYVPYDGYLAQLHRGEMILTALEARAYRAQQFADYGAMAALERRSGIVNNDNRRVLDGHIDNSVRVGDIYVRNETDISRLERQLTGRSRSVARGYGSTR